MALGIGSMVFASSCTTNAATIGMWGQISSGSAGNWSVLWRNGATTDSMADSSLTELTIPLVSGGLLRRRVIPTARCNPAMAGIVELQSAANVLVVKCPLGYWFGTTANVREI